MGPTLTHTRRQVPQCWASCSSCPGTKGHQGGRGQGQADIQGPAWDPKSCSPRSGLRMLAGLDHAGRDHHSAILSNCISGTPNSGNVLSRGVRSLPRWGSLAPTPPCDFSTPKGEKGLCPRGKAQTLDSETFFAVESSIKRFCVKKKSACSCRSQSSVQEGPDSHPERKRVAPPRLPAQPLPGSPAQGTSGKVS